MIPRMNRNQLKTILWLRWRLTQNQWSRSRGIGAAIAVIVAIAAVMLAALSFGGGVVAGALALKTANAETVRWVWFGLTLAFLFMWTVGLLSELQRSEAIDLQRLMHLPVALGQMFCFNYLASHMTLSIFLFLPAILGLTVGLTISNGPIMLLLAPLGLGMIFMISAWTYCLRGWLAAMMTNPRRRRAIIMGLTALFILLGQAPNIYFNVWRRAQSSSARSRAARADFRRAEEKRMLERLAAAEKLIPPLWVAVGADGLVRRNVLPALGATLGFAAIGGLGLRRAYRTTLRFYYGETGKNAPSPFKHRVEATSPGKRKRNLLDLRLRGVPEQAVAVAAATLRSFLRAPEVKMACGTSFIFTIIY
jgi:ABC-2 type transport system permease protein